MSRNSAELQSTCIMPSEDEKVARHSHEQFIRLFLQSERELLRYVMVFVPNVDDARDVVQETATALWQKFDQYDPNKPFVAWACRFALNEARMFLRKQSNYQKVLPDDVLDELQMIRERSSERLDHRRVHLADCLERLGEGQKDLIRAHYFDGLTVDELSNKFGRNTETLYKSLQRIRRGLHDCIKGKLAAEGKA